MRIPSPGPHVPPGLPRRLEVVSRQDEGRSVVELRGELDRSDVDRAEAALEEALASDLELVIDLGELEFLDLAGAALLARTVAVDGGRSPSLRPSRHLGVDRVLAFAGLGPGDPGR
jgi:anti-anti-sigma factor